MTMIPLMLPVDAVRYIRGLVAERPVKEAGAIALELERQERDAIARLIQQERQAIVADAQAAAEAARKKPARTRKAETGKEPATPQAPAKSDA